MHAALRPLRTLRRAPGFALAAILTLALGIGLSTTVFTVANALLVRRLPVADQDRLVRLAGVTPDGGMRTWPLTLDESREFEARSRALAGVAWVGYEGAVAKPVRDGGDLTRLSRALVSGDFFDVLGARPVLGRALGPADDARGAPPVLVLSHRAWRERWGGDPGVLGRRVTLHDDGTVYTIVGVMPAGLDFPRGTEAWGATMAVVPQAAEPYLALHPVGRLAPGMTVANAADELTAFFRRDGASPPQRALTAEANTIPTLVLGDVRRAVLVFAGAAAVLLLITCINVANLLLVRGLGRVQEVAVRTALGAGRGRVARELLAEHAMLALLGGAAGIVVAAVALRAFVALAPAGLPRVDEVRLDGAALAGAAGITAVAMLLFAVLPALLTTRAGGAEALRTGARQSAGRSTRRAAEWLVAGQVALALVVLSAAGLLARSFVQLRGADLAFDASRLLVAELALRQDRYGSPDAQRALLERLVPAVAAIPGVRAVTPTVAVPFSGTHGWDGKLGAEGRPAERTKDDPMLNMEVVTPGYFATFGVAALDGRTFTADDRAGGEPVVVVSRGTAAHFFPGERAVGRRLTMGPPGKERLFRIVGVVPDTRWRDLRDARASVYFPLSQSFFPFVPTTLAVRTGTAPEALVPALRQVLADVAPEVALASARPLEALMEGPLAQPRLNALLLAVFAAAAVTLAGVGLFGAMALMVRQRRREIGVRMALGATAADVRALVLRRGMTIALAGTGLGLLGALAANRALGALLFEVSPTDATTLGSVAAVLLVVAAVASLLPARAGARVAPATVLRGE